MKRFIKLHMKCNIISYLYDVVARAKPAFKKSSAIEASG